MAQGPGSNSRKETLKRIIRNLHNGLSEKEAADQVNSEIGTINPDELATIEQELITEGVPVEEIRLFCNVHALIFKNALNNSTMEPVDSNHPIDIFLQTNIKIKEYADLLLNALSISKVLIEQFSIVENHYQKKEQILFPFLEKHGFPGPSQVMWSKHDDIRKMQKEILFALESSDKDHVEITKTIKSLAAEISGMAEKEEMILYPAAKEKLTDDDWEKVKESYLSFDSPDSGRNPDEPVNPASSQIENNRVSLPSGTLNLSELINIFNTLPVDISFVDADDKVSFFSETKDRIFPRPRSVIGRKVQACHPPKSMHIVEGIIKSFRDSSKDSEDFWIHMNGKLIYIRYFAVRDSDKNYLGTLEVTQDISSIQKLEGEKRLINK